MKTLALTMTLTFALGCGPAAPPASNAPPPAPDKLRAPSPECVVEGPGEYAFSGMEPVPFDLFETTTGQTPVLRVDRPDLVGVAWSSFPEASEAQGRARVEIGGKQMVRLQAHASLRNRAFELRKRAISDPDHVWVQKSAVVQILGMKGDKLAISYATPFLQEPKTITAVVECDGLAYEMKDLPEAEEASKLVAPAGTYVLLQGNRLSLSRAPKEAPFFKAVFTEKKVFALLTVTDGWARVSTVSFNLGLEGWVPESDTQAIREPPSQGGYGTTGGRSAPTPRGTAVTVTVDSDLYVGHPGAIRHIEGASFEKGAKVHQQRTEGPFAEVELDGGEIVAAVPGDALWIAKTDVK